MKHTATSTQGTCAICGAWLGGPWLACSELCYFLLSAEEQLAVETVSHELERGRGPRQAA